MPQAITTMIVGTLLALGSMAYAGGDAPAAAGSLAQAQRLIEARDYASAMTILEDMLIEANAIEKPVIAALLKQAYEVLARQAHAAGRDRDAAHYRDNIAILEGTPLARDPAAPAPARSVSTPPERPQPSRPRDGSDLKAKNALEPRVSRPSVVNREPGQAIGPLVEPARLADPAKVASRESPIRPPSPRVSPISNPSGPVGAATSGSSATGPIDPPRDAAAAMAQPETKSPTTGPIAADTQPAAIIADPGPTLEQADRFFSDKKYNEAGRIYVALARENRLPVERRKHWAYCRMVDVAQRINSRPRTAPEWDKIEAEIQGIQQLVPKHWIGEYLRNIAAEARRGRGLSRAGTEKLIVRGSAPDENEAQSPPQRLQRLFGKSRPQAPPQADTEVAPASSIPASAGDGAERPAIRPGALAQVETPHSQSGAGIDSEPTGPAGAAPSQSTGDPEPRPAKTDPKAATNSSWQVIETVNFRVFHCNARLAEQAAEAAERIRAAQGKQWGSPALQRPWAPRCELYLYPDGPALARATGQPETAPGFSDLLTDGTRITTRRTVLRTDQPQWLAAVLPHEITHVVLADLFVAQIIPRWADEGMAVLAEPESEQGIRTNELHESLESGRILDLGKLMTNDQPRAKEWSLYYAQSVSLTRFLVEQDSPERFIKFLRTSNLKGAEPALRDVYRISSLADLRDRWMAYARQQVRRDVGAQSAATRGDSAVQESQ